MTAAGTQDRAAEAAEGVAAVAAEAVAAGVDHGELVTVCEPNVV